MVQGEPRRLAVVIEDDADVRHLLKTVLVRSGFEAVLASNGREGVEAVREHSPLITTLDVNMPGMDGFATAKLIREFSSTYLIMLTGLDDEIDVVQGLEAGADDYLVKPFRPRELRARIETVLRRPRHRDGVPVAQESAPAAAPAAAATAPPPAAPAPAPAAAPAPQQAPVHSHQPHPQQPQQPGPRHAGPQQPGAGTAPQRAAAVSHAAGGSPAGEDGWMRHGTLQLNVETRLVNVDGRSVDLTRTEFDLLASLMSTGRRVRSKADLVLTVRGQDYVTTYFVNEADKRAVEVHMANVRRKIGDSSATPRWIETVRGVGYRMADDS